jgi:simple sugar transport system ATP-binding protein
MANALELRNVEKSFGSVIALQGINIEVEEGAVTCILGDNGAGKSTLIKILSGVHKPSKGEFIVAGQPANYDSPRDALDAGIATVFQDLATIPLMSVWRNFFIGNKITKGRGPFRRLDIKTMKQIAKQQLLAMGIDLRDTNQAIGTLSGG